MLELWGMTELGGPATSHSPWWPARYGSIGLPFPQTEVRIANRGIGDESGSTGELMVRGPLVTQGYWNNSEATAEVRSEEHTSELQSLMRSSYAVFCLKKKKIKNTI